MERKIKISAAAGLAVLSGLMLAALSLRRAEDGLSGWDESLLRALRDAEDPAQMAGPAWVAQTMPDLTALGSHAVLTLAAVFAFILCLAARRGQAAAFLVLCACGSLLLNSGLKHLFARARPDAVVPLAESSTYSYPSGHALMSACLYLAFALAAGVTAARKTRIVLVCAAVVAAALTGLSRLYLGVHYPSDVLAGWSAGWAWTLACWLFCREKMASEARAKA